MFAMEVTRLIVIPLLILGLIGGGTCRDIFRRSIGVGSNGGGSNVRSTGNFKSFCLYGESSVGVQPGGVKMVKDLLPGDKVLVADEQGAAKYEAVYLDIHHNPLRRDVTFIRMRTNNSHTVTLTPKHSIYRGKDLVSAETIQIGDPVIVVDPVEHTLTTDHVTSITRLQADGVYNPLVNSGRVFVGDILTSAYPDLTPFTPQHQHYILWPVRQLVYQLTPEFVSHMLVDRDWYKYTSAIVESILNVYEKVF